MLLDIDLDFLNFIVNPSYEYLKRFIPYFKEMYIDEYGEEYREKITDNFNKVNYIFLEETSKLESFVHYYQSEIIFEAYQKLAHVFHIRLERYQCLDESHNFIEKEIIKEGLDEICADKNLKVFRNNLRNYLVEMKEKVGEEERNFLDIQIQYIDELVEKFDNIMAILNPKIEFIHEINQKKRERKVNLQREFIQKHSYWLKDETKQFIKKHEDYDVRELLKKSLELRKYITAVLKNSVFDMGELYIFRGEYNNNDTFLERRKRILIENEIDIEEIDLKDDDFCLKKLNVVFQKDGIIYHGRNALQKLEEELASYNRMLEVEYEKYKYLIPEEQFIRRYVMSEEFIHRKCNKDLQAAILSMGADMDEENCREIGTSLFDEMKNISCEAFSLKNLLTISGIFGVQDILLNYVIIKPLTWIVFGEGVLLNSIFYTLSHELGHVIASDKNSLKTGFSIEEKYDLLNELQNEKISNRIMNKLMNLFPIYNIKGTRNENFGDYKMNSFLIDPFLEIYESYFKGASIENDITILSYLMGEDLLEKYIILVNDFYSYHRSKYIIGDKMFEDKSVYIAKIRTQLQEILEELNQRRHCQNYIYKRKK